MRKNITIQDVAEHAGVSMMTVSRVLNKGGNVKDSTRQKIEQAVQDLGYRPNFAAKNLSSGRKNFIGVLCFEPNSPYVSQFLFGCLRYCSEVGYHLIVEENNADRLLDSKLQALCSGVDGVIVLPPLSEDKSLLERISAFNIPYVCVGQQHMALQDKFHSTVSIDEQQAAADLTSSLIEQGHTRIGFISGDKSQGVTQLRLAGYQQALQQHKLSIQPELIAEGDFSYKSALSATEQLLSLKDKPSAIFASNDEMAAAVMAVVHKHQFAIPKDISVVGFDDTSIATMVWPQLTTVRQPFVEMAKAAIDRISGQNPDAKTLLPSSITCRESHGQAAN
ncbi:LacI family DNA-binding transcriptional regulator [Neptunicella marina]|uniref:LacI family DNA-binding transcriptional regulator n=1 Tax=Neptunicella marina TaxID=2125989 RepID=A0A8J6ITT4_9ALTE|nr:LacI family DNA-binding transcriptional regulator [Neptunicella marina]MBC3765498.1 LacI family DNA-binding transcriptional regulator [Neptunicella marina]